MSFAMDGGRLARGCLPGLVQLLFQVIGVGPGLPLGDLLFYFDRLARILFRFSEITRDAYMIV